MQIYHFYIDTFFKPLPYKIPKKNINIRKIFEHFNRTVSILSEYAKTFI